MGTLEGKVAIVSGSGRGIGRAVAHKLAAEGARVLVNDLDEAPAEAVANEIRAKGGRATTCVGDVAAANFGDRFVGAALSAFNGLDIIINNAGYTLDNVVQKMSDDQFQTILDVHVLAPFRILRAAAEPIRMLSKKEAAEGREVFRKVVNVSSIAGTSGSAGQINYASAKAAVIGLTKSMAKEWGRYKVCVNCVAFGLIETRLTRPTDDPESKLDIGGREVHAGISRAALTALPAVIPLGRAGRPDEAAGGVYLFCVPESDYVTGQVLVVSGGLAI